MNILLALAGVGFAIFMGRTESWPLQLLSQDLLAEKQKAVEWFRDWLLSTDTGRAFWETGFWQTDLWSYADEIGYGIALAGLGILLLTALAPNRLVISVATLYASPSLLLLGAAVLAALVWIVALVVFLALALLVIGLAIGAGLSSK